MRLSQFTDYALRVLLYIEAAGPHQPGSPPIATGDIAEAYGISKHHLLKVVAALAEHGYIESVRGRSGGIRPLKPASEIRIGELVRALEPMVIVECHDPETNTCPIAPVCKLAPALWRAAEAFVKELDALTVADMVPRRAPYAKILIEGAPPAQ